MRLLIVLRHLLHSTDLRWMLSIFRIRSTAEHHKLHSPLKRAKAIDFLFRYGAPIGA
jgi:hypothetical protein